MQSSQNGIILNLCKAYAVVHTYLHHIYKTGNDYSTPQSATKSPPHLESYALYTNPLVVPKASLLARHCQRYAAGDRYVC